MYLKMFNSVRWVRVCSIIGIVVNTSFYFSFIVVFFFFETPHSGYTWLDMGASNNVTIMVSLTLPISAVGVGIDLYILALPLIAVSGIRMEKRKKIGVILLFSTGAL